MNYGIVAASTALLFFAGCGNNGKDTIEASGTIEGTEVNISTEAAGKVVAVRVEEGSRVKTGDTLLVIDDTEYQIQLRQAAANEQAVDNAYRLSVEGSRKEDVVQAEAAYKTADADYRRMKDLLASNTVTQKQYDDAYARYVAADQTFRKIRTGSRPEEIAAARGRRDQAMAQGDLLRKKIRDCHVLAPTNGTVTLRAVEPGELVGFGTQAFRIVDLDLVKLTIYLTEVDLGRIKLGQHVDVTIDAFKPGISKPGSITYISPVAEFTPKNVQTKEERTKLVFAVKVSIPNADNVLKPGLPADAAIIVSSDSSQKP
jgi:HlyD family secretion protein